MAWIAFGDLRMNVQDIAAYQPKNDFERDIAVFINDWLSGRDSFVFQTSGSTGTPKSIKIDRHQMVASAKNTIRALDLQPNDTALLCIHPAFIGGKMMIVRSLLHNMNLIVTHPTANPLLSINERVDFVAVVPMQLATLLRDSTTTKKLSNIRQVIVGGGVVSDAVASQLKGLKTAIHATYGMTETVSHIALKPLHVTPATDYFTAFDGIRISADSRGCLVINGEVTNNVSIVTNDIVELAYGQQFKWLGRYDNVINSGGIKIHTEQLEAEIVRALRTHGIHHRLFIIGQPDELLGEKVVLALEGDTVDSKKVRAILDTTLDRYSRPKEIIVIEKFQETKTGKILRQLS